MGMTHEEIKTRYPDIVDEIFEEMSGCTMSLNDDGTTDIPFRDVYRAVDIITKGYSKIAWD